MIDSNRPQDRSAHGAKAAIPIGKHPQQQFMGMGQIGKGFIGLLTQFGTSFIKLGPAVGVKKTIGPHHVSAFLRNMAQ